jgi:hypothetical protein
MPGKPAVEKLNSGTEETVSDTAIVDACVVKPARVGGRTGVTVTVIKASAESRILLTYARSRTLP